MSYAYLIWLLFRQVFFRPGAESHFSLKFTDSLAVQHTEAGEDYIFGADCAHIAVTILPSDRVEMGLSTHPLICWGAGSAFFESCQPQVLP